MFTAATPDAEVLADALQLEAEEEKEIAVSQLGPDGITLLLVNNNTSLAGSHEIAII